MLTNQVDLKKTFQTSQEPFIKQFNLNSIVDISSLTKKVKRKETKQQSQSKNPKNSKMII